MKCADCGGNILLRAEEKILYCTSCGIIMDEDGVCLSGCYGEPKDVEE